MISLFLQVALAASCQKFTSSCQCGPAVPFEGYQIYLVEKCDGKEEWFTQYGERQYWTVDECQSAIFEDRECKQLTVETLD